MCEPGIFAAKPESDLARKRDAIDLAGLHSSDCGVDAGHGNESRFRCRALGGTEYRGIDNTTDPYSRRVCVLDLCKPDAGRHEVGTLQQMIGIAEIDEFLALLVNRHKGDIPFAAPRRILNLT